MSTQCWNKVSAFMNNNLTLIAVKHSNQFLTNLEIHHLQISSKLKPKKKH